jgi:hypothetical protein
VTHYGTRIGEACHEAQKVPIEPGWFAGIGDYLSAIGIYWWGVVAVLAAMERYVERLAPGFWRVWVDPWFTPQWRKLTLIFFICAGFMVANFRAFEERSAELRVALANAAKAQGERDTMKNQVNELQREIDRLKTTPPPKASKNPDALYQFGEEVATVSGASINLGNSLITFQIVRSAGKLDASREVEYRDFVLSCTGLPTAPPPNVVAGVSIGMSMGVNCRILKKQ